MCYPEVICPRCKGTRYMKGQVSKETYTPVPNYKFNEDGLCFACDGDGTLLKRPDGKLVRRDLGNGNWLSYSPSNGDFIGVVQPILDDMGMEYEITYDKFKAQEDEEMNNLWVPIEPTFEVKETQTIQVIKPKSKRCFEEYDNPSIEELGRMCGLPEGVGLFDDDR